MQPIPFSNRTGLFVLFEGIPATVFESQVIMHALRMRSLGLHIDIVAFAPRAWIFSASKTRLKNLNVHGLNVTLYRCFRTSIPGARIANTLLLWRALRKSAVQYDFLHCRTEYAAAIGGLLKWIGGPPIIWDARGDTIAEADAALRSGGRIQKAMRNWRLAWIASNLRLAANKCDAALFVSDALRQCQGRGLKKQEVEIIPCVADENFFFFDPELRRVTRATLGFDEQDIVCVFSGSLAPWQCFSETVQLFKTLYARASERMKFLVLTPDIDLARAHLVGIPETALLVTAVPLTAVNAYLNAADFGMLLREQNSINYVASPVKFAEYALSGLSVVATSAVKQVIEFGNMLGNVIECNEKLDCLCPKSDLARIQFAAHAKTVLGRKGQDVKYMRLYESMIETKLVKT